MAELPVDWREQMTAMVSGSVPLDPTLFGGGPSLSPIEQIGIYADQYCLRMFEALEDEVLGLAALLGDEKTAVLWRFLRAHPSTSWTLNDIAIGLTEWLTEQGAPVEQIEMAAVDFAVQQGFTAADPRPISPEDLQTIPPLEVSAGVSLLKLSTNVHRVRSALLGGEELAVEHGEEVWLIVFRAGLKMRHYEAEVGLWHLLEALQRGLSVGEALEDVVAKGWVTEAELGEKVQGWFRELVQHQWVQIK